MVAFVPLLLLAASTRVDLVNDVYHIPPREWRYVELGLKQNPALVSAHFEGIGGPRDVRLALMRRDDLEHLRAGLPHGVIAETTPGGNGDLHSYVPATGDYVVVVDNLSDTAARLHLRISLDFLAPPGPEARLLSPQRRWTVIAISFAVFFGIVTFSARRLLRSIRRQS
jgi:hypothetical protein